MKKKYFTALLLIILLILIITTIFLFLNNKKDDTNDTISFYTFIISNELINKNEEPINITKDSFKELYTWELLDDDSIEKITNYFSDYNINIVEQKDLHTTDIYFKIDLKFYKKNSLKFTVEKYYDNKSNSTLGSEVEFKKGSWNYSSGIGFSTQN